MQIYIFANVIKETKASCKFVSSTERDKEHRVLYVSLRIMRIFVSFVFPINA